MAVPWTLKYRPRRFGEVTGQRAARLILSQMILRDDVRPALLFHGSHGSGKTSMARIFAAALNCVSETPESRPCGVCAVCSATAEGCSPDVTEIDAASSGMVDDVRALREAVRFAAQSRYRVVILDEALALDTPIPTPDGWSTIGKIQPGEFVVGSVGRPVRVVRKTEIREDAVCYRVLFMDGTSIVASSNHQWYVKLSGRTQWLPRVLTTEEMVTHGGRFMVPLAKSLDLGSSDVPVSAYLLGLWLGDGTTGQPHISGDIEDLQFYAQRLLVDGIQTRLLSTAVGKAGRLSFAFNHDDLKFCEFHPSLLAHSRGLCRSCYGKLERSGGLPDRSSRSVTGVATRLRRLSCYSVKHIPLQYLRAPKEVREELLRGLMDSDGCVTSQGICTFVGNEVMARGVFELLYSLGQKPNKLKWVSDIRSRAGGCYQVSFMPQEGLIPVALPRKVANVRQTVRKTGWRTILGIERVESVPVQCLEVDSEDHLFVVGDGFVVTHNCHEMTTRGFQTLLKTLEEPPAQTVFILATTNLDRVPDTIASRCLSVEFRRLTEEQIAGRLAQVAEAEGFSLSSSLALAIASRCRGIARDSVSLLEQCALVGVKSPEQLAVLLGDSDHGLAVVRALIYRSEGGQSPSPLLGDYSAAFAAAESALAVLPSPQELVASVVRTLRRVLCITSVSEGGAVLNPPATSDEISVAGQLDVARCVTAMRTVWEYYTKVAPAADAYAAMDLLITLLGQALAPKAMKRAS